MTLCIPHSLFIINNLPHGMLCYNFEYHEPYVLINSVSLIKYDLVLQCTLYNLAIRRNIAMRPRLNFTVNDYETHNIDDTTTIINLPKNVYCQGFFIESKVLSERVKIHVNNDTVCGFINQENYKYVNTNNKSFYWVSFCQNITWNNISYVYNGYCNNGFLEFSPCLPSTIYFLIRKNMMTSAGMAGIIST